MTLITRGAIWLAVLAALAVVFSAYLQPGFLVSFYDIVLCGPGAAG